MGSAESRRGACGLREPSRRPLPQKMKNREEKQGRGDMFTRPVLLQIGGYCNANKVSAI